MTDLSPSTDTQIRPAETMTLEPPGTLRQVIDDVLEPLRDEMDASPEMRYQKALSASQKRLQAKKGTLLLSSSAIEPPHDETTDEDLGLGALDRLSKALTAYENDPQTKKRTDHRAALNNYRRLLNDGAKGSELKKAKDQCDELATGLVPPHQDAALLALREEARRCYRALRAVGENELAEQVQARILRVSAPTPDGVEGIITVVRSELNKAIKRHGDTWVQAEKDLTRETRKASKRTGRVRGHYQTLQRFTDDAEYGKLKEAKAAADSRAAARNAELVEAEADLQAKRKAEQDADKALRRATEGQKLDRYMQFEARWKERRAAETKFRDAKKPARKANDEAEAADPDVILTKTLQHIVDFLPAHSPNHVLFDGLATTAKLAAMDKSYDSIKDKTRTALTGLTNPGSSADVSLTVEAGLALKLLKGAFKLELTNVTGIKHKVERTAKGELKATFENSSAINVNFKVGDIDPSDTIKAAVRANVEAGLALGRSRTYKTEEEMLANESRLAMLAVLRSTDAGGYSKYMRERERLLLKAHQAQPYLETRINSIRSENVERKDAQGKLIPKKNKRPLRIEQSAFRTLETVETVTKSVSGGAAGSIGIGRQQGFGPFAGAGLGYKHKRTTQRDYLTVSFLDDIMGNENLQRLHRYANGARFRFADYDQNGGFVQDVFGDDGATALNDRINRVKDLLPESDESEISGVQRDLERNLEFLRLELNHFVQITNEIAEGRVSKKNADMRDRFLKLRGLTTGQNAGYFKALSVQYATMRGLYEQSFAKVGRTMPNETKLALNELMDDLKTPRIKIDKKTLQREFGDKAVSDKAIVHSNSINAVIALGLKEGTGLGDPMGSAEELDQGAGKRTAALGVSLNVAWNADEKWKPGSDKPDITKSVEFSLTHSGGGFVSDEGLKTLVAKLLSTRSLISATTDEREALEQECFGALKAVGAGLKGRVVRLDFVRVDGRDRLKTAMSADQDTKRLGHRQAIGEGAAVILGLQVATTKRQVVAMYHSSKTLSGITDAYRVNNKTNAADDTDWATYKKDSRLLERLVTQLATDSNGTESDSGNLVQLLTGIKNDSAVYATKESRNLWKSTNGTRAAKADLTNETLDWLIDLKSSSDDAVQAVADTFIDTFLQHRAALRKTDGSQADAVSAVAGALEKVVAAKKTKEDDAFESGFHKQRGLTGIELEQYIGYELSERFRVLRKRMRDTPGDDHEKDKDNINATMKQLRARALRRVLNNPAKAENLQLLQEVMALDYAVESLSDLTQFNDEADKNKAIGMLGADLEKLLNPSLPVDEQSKTVIKNVYVNDMIDGELVPTDDGKKLKLRLVLKKGTKESVSKAMTDKSYLAATIALNTDVDADIADSNSVVVYDPANLDIKMVPEAGGAAIPWVEGKYYEPKKEKAYFKKRADKTNYRIPVNSRSRASRDFFHRGTNRPIGELIGQLIAAQTDKQRKQAKNVSRGRTLTSL